MKEQIVYLVVLEDLTWQQESPMISVYSTRLGAEECFWYMANDEIKYSNYDIDLKPDEDALEIGDHFSYLKNDSLWIRDRCNLYIQEEKVKDAFYIHENK